MTFRPAKVEVGHCWPVSMNFRPSHQADFLSEISAVMKSSKLKNLRNPTLKIEAELKYANMTCIN